jgi:hypothetical protein
MLIALNLIIAFCCSLIAGIEANNGVYPAAFTYGGFAFGYIGLSWLYGTM